VKDAVVQGADGTAVVADVDLLVLGGNTAGVAAAVAAAEAGRRVLLATPRTFLGEDLTAFLRLTEPPGELTTILARRIFGNGVPTPMRVKETLERELLHAGVELLFGCHPGGVMVAGDDRIAGAGILSRAGRHVVRARAVIDATWSAVFARQADCRFRDDGPRDVTFTWTLSAPEAPPGAEAAGKAIWRVDEKTSRELPLWKHRFTARLDLDDPASLAAVEVDARRRYFRPDQYFEADNVFFVPPWRIDTGTTMSGLCDPAKCDPQSFSAKPGLWVISAAVDADDSAMSSLLAPARFIAVGQRLGAHIAENLPGSEDGALEWQCRGAKPVTGVRLDGRDLRGGTAAGLPMVKLPTELPVFGSTDVLVVGAGTAGAPAGIAVARDGKRALVVEALPGPGGLGTWGQISTYFCGYKHGFTLEVDAGVASMGQERLKPAWGWRVAWKRAWWTKALLEAGSTLWPDTVACGVQVKDGRVTGVVVAGPCGFGLISAGCVVDSSGNADLVAAAGGRVIQPGREHAAVQGTGLSPREPGRDYANSDHTFSDDGDVRDVTRSFVGARRKFRERFDLAPILSTRERRRIEAEVMIQPEDVFAGRTWPDALNLAKSSFDTHGFTIHPLFTAVPTGRSEEYLAVVPLRALLPKGLEGILVTGLGIGAHRDVMPVVRMQPCVQNQGYAVGLVAVAALGKGGNIRAVDLGPIQDRLVKMGILDSSAWNPDPFPVGDAALDAAVLAEPHTHRDLAAIFAHRDRALPRLRAALTAAKDGARRERLAVILGLMGDSSGSNVLAEAVSSRSWDQGWNYRGMDQFEASRSPLDSLLWAVAGAPTAELFSPVLVKVQDLSNYRRLALQLELSHAQSIAAVCSAMSSFDAKREFPPLLARMLGFHQIAGNHQSDWEAVFCDQPRCVNHNEARNRALRELALAVGLWKCGDHEGAARVVLDRYASDWRGPLAHHARAVLESGE
jgi:NADPH-dependent 2,4-dienoyl-CoA reductase/sulfur reductase-like enzyme